MITNIAISIYGEQGAKHTEPKDFIINWNHKDKQEVKKQTTEQMKEFLLSFAKKHNKALKEKKK